MDSILGVPLKTLGEIILTIIGASILFYIIARMIQATIGG